MSNDRRQTAPIEQPVDGAVKTSSIPPSPPDASAPGVSALAGRAEPTSPDRVVPVTPTTPLPGSLRDARDGAVARRRHALRIPDDEISRPQLPGGGARAAPASEPAMPPEPASVVKPTRIITISEPPPAGLDDDRSEPGAARVPPQRPAVAPPAPFAEEDALEVSMGPEGDEVEVRFDDDFPPGTSPPTTPVARLAPPADPQGLPEPARDAAELGGLQVRTPPAPEEPGQSVLESPRPAAEVAVPPAEPGSTHLPGEPARPLAEVARAAVVTASQTTDAYPKEGAEDEVETEAEVPLELERRKHPSDAPEVAAEDVVTLEPPPVRPMSALPPMRLRAMSQPATQQSALPSLGSLAAAPAAPQPPSAVPQPAPVSAVKPPRIPTPRTSLVIVPPHVGSMPSQQDGAATRRKIRLWWEELFNDDYLRATEKIGDEQLKQEVSFIEESLGVERGGTLLDLACGTGRHAIELARRGYEVVGFDLSLAMLARAGEEAQDLGAKLNFVQGDMREMAFEEQFDGVYCWSTSFGYFEEDKNSQVVARIGRALKAGGTFLLDVANRDFLVRQSPSLAWFEGDGCVCMDEMSLDFITSRLKVKRTMMIDDGRSREIEYSMRVYSLHELGKILHEHGFKVREVSGRLATPGVFFGNESPRAIILAEKK